jgi:hypothetical protein
MRGGFTGRMGGTRSAHCVITGIVKLDKLGRRLCEYPYCKNYAENKGIRNGEQRYRPWCEKHRYVKIRAKRYAVKSAAKPAAKPKRKAHIRSGTARRGR